MHVYVHVGTRVGVRALVVVVVVVTVVVVCVCARARACVFFSGGADVEVSDSRQRSADCRGLYCLLYNTRVV